MSHKRVRLLLHWGGKIIKGSNGFGYDIAPKKGIVVDSKIRCQQLIQLLYQKTGIDGRQFRLKVTCRYPHEEHEQSFNYTLVPIEDDDFLPEVLSIPKYFPRLKAVELFLEQESIMDVPGGTLHVSCSRRVRENRSFIPETSSGTHRSNRESSSDIPLDIRRSDNGFWSARPLDARVQHVLLQVGFYGVYKCGNIQLDHSLITALVERWKQHTHTFHLPVGEATVTLQDVGVLWGLPIDGDLVIGADVSRTIAQWQDICLDLMGFVPRPEDFDGNRLKTRAIKTGLDLHPLQPESDRATILFHARGRIMQLLGNIMGDKSGSKVKLRYLELLRDIDIAGQLSWGSAVLASLYRALCQACIDGVKQIAGPILLLQLWAWERLPMFTPVRRHVVNPILIGPNLPSGPRGSLWDVPRSFATVGQHVLRICRDKLDHMREDGFIWMPYSERELDTLPAYCLQGRDIWRASVPLICFELVEYHFPERVTRQFGIQQRVPVDAYTDLDLHRIDRRGRVGKDWRIVHAAHIRKWEDRQDYIVDGAPFR